MPNYKTAISFGLVHIPVNLNPIIKDNNATFNFLHKKCLSRIKYEKICPHCKEEVHNKDLIKGYEYAKENYVTLNDEDFEKLKSDGDKNIEIISFIDGSEIDPIYYDKSYYLKADVKNKAFSLLRKALNKKGKVALAKTILGNKSYYVTLRFSKDNIIMNTLYYEEEIRLNEEEIPDNFTKEELDLALKLIDSMSGKFKPEEYVDEYQTGIKNAINAKIEGKEIKAPKKKKTKSINDLMSALEESIKSKKG